MRRFSMKSMLCLIGCMVLIAAMALSFVGCSDAGAETEPAQSVSFQVIVTDPDGNETTFDYTTDKKTVGDALLAEGLIAGEEGEYGLYVTTVNGITLDWDADQMYWAFYIDGEYAQTGIDLTDVTDGAVYSLVAEG